MSQMILSGAYFQDIHLNVLSFSSPIFQQFVSAQTKHMIVHFPIKTNQPNISFSVQFSNEADLETFQRFIRKHQVTSVGEAQAVPEVKIKWPERNMDFTGFIQKFQAGGKRFNVAPRAQFTVILVKSFVTDKTTVSSKGSPYTKVYGPQINILKEIIGDVTDLLPSIIDSLIRLPRQVPPPSSDPQRPFFQSFSGRS
jgi:hypothetical protein